MAKARNDYGVCMKIPEFSSDEEAARWYEEHPLTDHLEDTEEVDDFLYVSVNGFWAGRWRYGYWQSYGTGLWEPIVTETV